MISVFFSSFVFFCWMISALFLVYGLIVNLTFHKKKMVGKLILKSNNWKSSFLAVTSVEDGIVYGAQPIIQKL